jgi:hypothetical protein
MKRSTHPRLLALLCEASRRRSLCGLGFELALLLVPLLAWRRGR